LPELNTQEEPKENSTRYSAERWLGIVTGVLTIVTLFIHGPIAIPITLAIIAVVFLASSLWPLIRKIHWNSRVGISLISIMAISLVLAGVIGYELRNSRGGGPSPAPTIFVTITPSPTASSLVTEPSITATAVPPTIIPTSTAAAQTHRPPVSNPPIFYGGPVTLNNTYNLVGVSFDTRPFQIKSVDNGDVELGTDQDNQLILKPSPLQGAASLWNSGGTPSYDGCNAATTSNASPGITLHIGQVICVQSMSGRIGYMVVKNANSTSASFQVTVWEKRS
jgi:hypothetical protein